MRFPCFGVGLHEFSCFSCDCGLNQVSRAGFDFATPQMCIGCQDAWEAGCQMVALNGQKSCLEAFRLLDVSDVGLRFALAEKIDKGETSTQTRD